MNARRRPRIAAFVVLVALGAPAPARATPFADVPFDSWPYHAIQTLAADGLIEGYPDGAFQGDRALTGAELAAIVARVIAKIDAASAQTAARTDLDTLQQRTRRLAYELAALGVRVAALEHPLAVLDQRGAVAPAPAVPGMLPVSEPSPGRPTNPTLAAGDRPLSRDEMAAIVERVIAMIDAKGARSASKADLDALQKRTGGLSGELDALGVRVTALENRLAAPLERTSFAQSLPGEGPRSGSGTPRGEQHTSPTIRTLAAAGLIEGYPDGTFKGDRPLTRYEMAAMLARVIAKIEAEGARTASRADLDSLQRLTAVIADELDALGARVTALEDRRAGRTPT